MPLLHHHSYGVDLHQELRAGPETMATVIAGGFGRVPHIFMNATRAGWMGWS